MDYTNKGFTGNNLDDVLSKADKFFNVSEIAENSNLNTFTTSGRYASPSGVRTATLTNVPDDVGTSFILYVIPFTGVEINFKVQILIPANRAALYLRYQSGTNAFDYWMRIPLCYQGYKQKGTTAQRPVMNTTPTSTTGKDMYNIGYYYFDTDLGKPIWWNGNGWVDATGASV